MAQRNVRKEPTSSIEAAYELKREPKQPSDWSDVISLVMLALAALGIAIESISLSFLAFCVTLSLFINKPSSWTTFPQTLMCLGFAAFTIWVQYVGIHVGARSHWGKPVIGGGTV
jgi:amino acid transporter